MGKTVKIICDGCGADLTSTGNSVDYRLVLANERKPIHEGLRSVTDVNIPLPVSRAHYFCRLSCLDGWMHKHLHGGGRA